jgi:hypothetical protein
MTSSSLSTWLTVPPPVFPRRDLCIDEMQRHFHVDLLVLGHALKVDVHEPRPATECIWTSHAGAPAASPFQAQGQIEA